jgi:hypothetical protein
VSLGDFVLSRGQLLSNVLVPLCVRKLREQAGDWEHDARYIMCSMGVCATSFDLLPKPFTLNP